MSPIRDALTDLDPRDLTEWVVAQRWFSAKSRDVALSVRDALVLDEGRGLGIALVEARTPAGTHELFQLVVGADPDGTTTYDALGDPDRAAVLADLLRRGGRIGDDHRAIELHWLEGAPALGDPPSVRPLRAEQSNSSIVIDEAVVLKVFRHLEPGENPELEMLQFLSRHGFAHIPPLAGWYQVTGELLDATLGVAQGFLAGAANGWDLAIAELGGPGDDRLTPRLGELGRVVGEMHTVLGSDVSDPAFAPEVAGDESLALFVATVDEEIEQVFSNLPDHEVFAPIAGRGEALRDRLQRMAPGGVPGRLIRHHGDLHLGQTMLSDDGWTILDFEGEPSRPLIERRRKRSPLRDVAGMLRSFAYAASAAERAGRPVPDGWEDEARRAFLAGYLGAVDPTLLPAGEAAVEQVLAVFELEKAIYELRYEIDNRPDWAAIPVAGIARLLAEEEAS